MHEDDWSPVRRAFIDVVHARFGAVIGEHRAVSGRVWPIDKILETRIGSAEHDHAGHREAIDRYHFSLLM